MKITHSFGIGVLGATLILGSGLGCAHDPAPAAASTTPAANAAPETASAAMASAGGMDGKAQAALGGQLYGKHCAKCHGDGGQGTDEGPPVVGAAALPLDPPAKAKGRKSKFHTARDVYDFVKPNMPAKKGGSLTDDEYLAIMAFDLQANGVDLTGKTITPDSLSAIVLHP